MKISRIPRDRNKVADSLSRYSDCDDWGISKKLFDHLDEIWGKHSIDRFATDYNNKCIRFNSKFWCKGSEAVDALAQCWNNDNIWVVPPPSMICKVINKMCTDKASGTLIVPFWTSAPYWVLLFEKGNYKRFIKETYILPKENSIVPGRGNNGIFTKSKKFCMIALKIRF